MSETARGFWEAQVETDPDAISIVADGRTWTYAEFDAAVNRLANGLRDHGVNSPSRSSEA